MSLAVLKVKQQHLHWTARKKRVLVIYICLLLAILRPSILIFCVLRQLVTAFASLSSFKVLGVVTGQRVGWSTAQPISRNGRWESVVLMCFVHLAMTSMGWMQRI